jgi:hypothetical protein
MLLLLLSTSWAKDESLHRDLIVHEASIELAGVLAA